MANYVMNRVVMAGIKHLPLFNAYGQFDFNRIVPMPQPLRGIAEGSVTPDAILYTVTNGLRLAPNEILPDDKKVLDAYNFGGVYGHFVKMDERITRLRETLARGDKFAENYRAQLEKYGPVYVDNIRKYGHPTWHGWSLEHWGVKWSAFDTSFPAGEDEIIFFTSWDAPTPVLLALSEKYPDSEIELAYCDEDPYGAMGYATFVNGQEIDDPVDPQSSKGKALYEELVGFYPSDEDNDAEK